MLQATRYIAQYRKLKSKRILLVTGVFPPKIGGPSGQAYELLKLFGKMNITAGIITFGSGKRTEATFQKKSFIIRTRFSDSKIGNYLVMLCYMLLTLLVYRPDIVHQQTGIDKLSILTILLAKLFNVRALVKFTGDWTWESTPQNGEVKYEDIEGMGLIPKVKTIIQKAVLGQYDVIWSTSSFQTGVLIRKFRQNKEKIVEIPNFIKIEAIVEDKKEMVKEPVRLLTVSRFVRWKRVEEVIGTVYELRKIGMKVTLTIIGGGDKMLYSGYLAEVRNKGLADCVRFVFNVDPRRIKKYYQLCDIYLSATEYEPFGIVFLEAMEAGLPIVAKKTGGVVDIVKNGVNGYLIDGDNFPVQAALKVRKLARDRSLYTRLSQNAKRVVKEYDINILGRKLVDHYMSC